MRKSPATVGGRYVNRGVGARFGKLAPHERSLQKDGEVNSPLHSTKARRDVPPGRT